jgi:hypothetical protein
MKIKVHFRDGFTGGFLTTEHSRSSYGLPVFIPDDYTRIYLPEDCYGPGDLGDCSPFIPNELVNEETLMKIRNAGFKIEI